VGMSDYRYGVHSRGSDLWSLGGKIGAQLVQVAGFAVLARILAPSEFGILAAAAVFVGFAQVFSDLGLSSAIVARKNLTPEFLSTVFVLNLSGGILAAIVVGSAGIPLARLLGFPDLQWFIPLLAVSLPLTFSSAGSALLERSFRFRALGISEIGAGLVGQAVGVGCAIGGFGTVSLAVIQPTSALIFSVLTLLLSGWRPRLQVSATCLREIVAYVWPLVSANFVNYWARSIDNLLVAKMFGADVLAFYARSYQLMLAPVMQANLALGRVYQAVFASELDDGRRTEIRYRHAEGDVALFGMMVTAAVWPNVHEIIVVLFGSQWEPMAPLLGILSLSIAPQVVTSLNGALLRAASRTRLLLWSGLINAISLALVLSVAAFWSVSAMAWTIVVHAFVAAPVTILLTCRALRFAAREIAREVFRVLPLPLAFLLGQLVVRKLDPSPAWLMVTCEALLILGSIVLAVLVVRKRTALLCRELGAPTVLARTASGGPGQ
jgi:O-antigen/teichoic acid export membrane protein